MSIEQTVLSNILINESYARKVVPFIKEEYFQNVSERTIPVSYTHLTLPTTPYV